MAVGCIQPAVRCGFCSNSSRVRWGAGLGIWKSNANPRKAAPGFWAEHNYDCVEYITELEGFPYLRPGKD